jgi:hypothetical protein
MSLRAPHSYPLVHYSRPTGLKPLRITGLRKVGVVAQYAGSGMAPLGMEANK